MIDRIRDIVQRHRALLLVAAVLALLVGAAAATPDGLAFLPSDGEERVVVPDFPPALDVILAVFALLTLAGLLVANAIYRRESLAGGLRRPRPGRALLVAFVFLVLAWRLFPELAGWLTDLFGGETGGSSPDLEGGGRQPPNPAERTPSGVFGWVVTAIVLVGGLGFFALVAWILRPIKSEGEELTEPALIAAVEAGIEDLEAIQDPREAVLSSYERMQRLVPSVGIRAHPSDAPFELLARLSDSGLVPEPAARRLTELFETARFSTATIDEGMREDAIRALRSVRDEIGVRA